MAAIKDCGEGYSGPAIGHCRGARSFSSQRRAAPSSDGLTRDHVPDFVRVNPGHSKRHREELAECLAKSVSCCHYWKAICTGGDGGTLPPVAQLTVFATEIQTSLSSSVLVFCIMTR